MKEYLANNMKRLQNPYFGTQVCFQMDECTMSAIKQYEYIMWCNFLWLNMTSSFTRYLRLKCFIKFTFIPDGVRKVLLMMTYFLHEGYRPQRFALRGCLSKRAKKNLCKVTNDLKKIQKNSERLGRQAYFCSYTALSIYHILQHNLSANSRAHYW